MDKNFMRQTIQDSQTVRIAARGGAEGAFCLIVEDDDACSETLTTILGNHNYNSKKVTTVEDAITIIHEERSKIMCAIIDLHLEKHEGDEVLREIESVAPEIPCIIYTADSMAGQKAHERFPRANVVLKGSSMYALLAAFGFGTQRGIA